MASPVIEILKFCDKEDWKSIFFISFLIILLGTLELIGIGAIFPYMKILGDPSIIKSNQTINQIYTFFGFSKEIYFMIFLGAAIFTVILLKGALTFINNYVQNVFGGKFVVKLSRKFLSKLLRTPYNRLIILNSSKLAKHLLNDFQQMQTLLNSGLVLCTDIIQSTILISLILYTSPPGIWLVLLLIIGMATTSILITKNKFKTYSQLKEERTIELFKISNETLTGIKDIKVYQAEDIFTEKFSSKRTEYFFYKVKLGIMANLPGIIFNIIGFGAILAIILTLLIIKGSILETLPTLAIVALAIQRLMPSAIRINTSLGNVRQSLPIINALSELMNIVFAENTETQNNPSSQIKNFKNLKLEFIEFTYPNTSIPALKNINIDIEQKGIYGFVGESGAGKSTLIDLLLGFLPPQKGKILINNQKKKSNESLRGLVGYVPQQTVMLDDSIRSNIAFGIPESEIIDEQVWKCLKIAQLSEFVNTQPEKLDTTIGDRGIRLSGGQRQRIGIARALYRNPEILIMDEATNALDSKTEKEFNQALKTLLGQKTIIIIAHRLSSVRFCEKIFVMRNGQIVDEGTFDELSVHSNEFSKIYGDLSSIEW